MQNKKISSVIGFWILVSLSLVSCASTKFEGKATLTGRVCDEKGIGVPDYYVSIGLGNTTVTDISGVFVFRNVSSDSYHLTGGGFGWNTLDTKVNFYDRKAIVCVQVERLEKLFPKIENLLREGKFDEAKKILTRAKDYNEKNSLYLFYRTLIAYCESPTERHRKQLMTALEKI